MTTDSPATPNEHADAHGPSHQRLFVYVFIALLGLTAVSFAIANSALMKTPAIGWAAMMAVSVGKAFLVIAFFMHLKWETNWKFVLTIPATVMSVLICLVLIPDIMFRTEDYSHTRRTHAAEPITHEQLEAVLPQGPPKTPDAG